MSYTFLEAGSELIESEIEAAIELLERPDPYNSKEFSDMKVIAGKRVVEDSKYVSGMFEVLQHALSLGTTFTLEEFTDAINEAVESATISGTACYSSIIESAIVFHFGLEAPARNKLEALLKDIADSIALLAGRN
jgi:hypothetical protein